MTMPEIVFEGGIYPICEPMVFWIPYECPETEVFSVAHAREIGVTDDVLCLINNVFFANTRVRVVLSKEDPR